MNVQADELQAWRMQNHAAGSLQRIAGRKRQAELGFGDAGRNVFVRVRINGRRKPEQHTRRHVQFLRQTRKWLNLVQIVYDDVINAHRKRRANFGGRFVVAVQVNTVARIVHAAGNFEFAFGGDFNAQPSAFVDARKVRRKVCFRRVKRQRVRPACSERLNDFARAGAQVRIVKNIEWSAKLVR